MDPLTAALQLANTVAQIVLLVIQREPPEVTAEYARLRLKVTQDMLALVDRLSAGVKVP